MSRGLWRALAVGPGLVASTLLTWMFCALLPPPWGLALFVGGVVLLGLLAAGVGEEAAARGLSRARPLEDDELATLRPALTLLSRGRLGPPLVELRVNPRDRRMVVEPLGRRTVVVAGGVLDAAADGRLSQEQAAALIGHTAGVVRDGWFRRDLAVSFWSLPWLTLRALAHALAATLSRLPLVAIGWRLRFVVAGIAVAQAVHQGQPWVAALLGTLGALSYLMPRWERHWRRAVLHAGDGALVDAGLAEPWASLLRRQPLTATTRGRLRDLEPPPAPGAALSLAPSPVPPR
ncbi:hypothetical protein LG324_03635 [Phycicoccus jejuensis]|uniref:hypothetical protein n=1 Tax=Phycicoccus jejuensis TaxID=367299 RepID=UPI00384D57B3